MKDEYGLHMIGWMILTQVSTGWFSWVSLALSLSYASLSLFELWGNRK